MDKISTSLGLACAWALVGCIETAITRAEPAPPRLRDIYEELVEINTVTNTGDTARAADAMSAHLLAAGFDPDDVHVIKPVPRKGNLVARLRGDGTRRPLIRSLARIRDRYWPRAVLFPIMTPGASDAAFLRNAGIATYGIGLLDEIGELRAHGRDERVAVASFESGEQWLYDLVRLIAAPGP